MNHSKRERCRVLAEKIRNKTGIVLTERQITDHLTQLKRRAAKDADVTQGRGSYSVNTENIDNNPVALVDPYQSGGFAFVLRINYINMLQLSLGSVAYSLW